jgi:hypothetical protein
MQVSDYKDSQLDSLFEEVMVLGSELWPRVACTCSLVGNLAGRQAQLHQALQARLSRGHRPELGTGEVMQR